MAKRNVWVTLDGEGSPTRTLGGDQAEVMLAFDTPGTKPNKMYVMARMSGNLRSDERRRKDGGGDNRKALVTIQLPEEGNPERCEVKLSMGGSDGSNVLVPIGGKLVKLSDLIALHNNQ
jgi:hypothetical protein